MKLLMKCLIIVSLVFVVIPNLSYGANNKKFYGNYEAKLTDNCAETYFLTVGGDVSRITEDRYLYIPSKGKSFIQNNVITTIKKRKITYSWAETGDAGSITYAFSKSYKSGTINGVITDGPCTGTITGSFKNIFTGKYKISMQSNDNIRDGVHIYKSKITAKIIQKDPDKLTFTSGKFSIPLVQSGNMATLLTHPYYMGPYNQLEFLLLSDGNNMVAAISGQEAYDLADISWSVANWLRTSKRATIDDFVGTWDVNLYVDPNLGDTGDGFGPTNETITISKLDSNSITVDIDGNTLSLAVSKGRATITNAPVTIGSTTYQAFSIVTDGTGLSLYLVADPTVADSTDVSVTIGLGTKQ
jgi:hypothetical protein